MLFRSRINAEGVCQTRSHRVDVRREPRRFRDYGSIDVHDCEASVRDETGGLTQQPQAVGVPVRLVVGGEVAADVAQRGGAQQRVNDRVQQDVGIAVSDRMPVVRNIHPADAQRPARFEAMPVLANTYTCRLRGKSSLSRAMSAT